MSGEVNEPSRDVAVPLLHPVIQAVGLPRDPDGRGAMQDGKLTLEMGLVCREKETDKN